MTPKREDLPRVPDLDEMLKQVQHDKPVTPWSFLICHPELVSGSR
jgi:hypothetical protein